MERTHRWAKRCRDAQTRDDQSLYGIIQGGVFPELRAVSVGALLELGFAGYAIGGLSLGEPKTVTYEMVARTTELLPDDKARYLMGVGSPEDIVTGISLGIDIFDSALPTRVARNGALFTREGRRNISNTGFASMDEPIERECQCYTCQNFSAAYLHHLFNCKELLAYRLATIHNLYFIRQLISGAREAIMTGTMKSFLNGFLNKYKTTDEKVRLEQKRRWLQSRTQPAPPEAA
jgi:queuine tRNA-ribosyltransferase